MQNYRDNTRYNYFKVHYDYVPINEVSNLSAGWEFLDHPDEKKTIALALDWSPPGHRWFFYPLMGRWLQNDIVYISAKYKWEVPAWLHRGMLRGDDFSVWLSNLERNKVDYIFVMKPWPDRIKMDGTIKANSSLYSRKTIAKFTGTLVKLPEIHFQICLTQRK